MPSSVYDISIRLGLNASGLAGTAGAAMAIFKQLETRAAAAGASTAALSRSMALLGGGLAVTGVGVALADGLAQAAKKGAELQVVMAGIGMATGATQRQIDALSLSFVGIGLKNQMSQIDVANLALASTHAGITNLAQLRASIGTIANFAEVQQLSTGVSREWAATTGVEYAHLFNAYTPQLLNPLINVLSKALTHTPLSGKGFETLVSQFSGMVNPLYGRSAKGLLRSETDDTMMGVLLGQMGQGPRGGTQFGSGLIHMLKARPGSGAYAAEQRLEQLGGGRFTTADGTYLGNKNLLTILTRARQHMDQNQALQANFWAFGSVGMKLFGNLETPARLGQWDQNAKTFARIPGVDQQQAVFNATAAGQSQQWHKNIETIETIFGTALLPTLVKVSNALVGITRRVVEFMQANPQVVRFAAGFAMVATAAALIIGPVLAAAGAFGLLAAASVPVLPLVLGITAAVATLAFVVTHWSDVVRVLNDPMGALTGKFGLLGQAIVVLGAPLIGLIDGFRLLWGWGVRLLDWAGGFQGVATAVGGAVGVIGSYFSPLVQMFSAILDLGGHLVDWASKLPGVAGAISMALHSAFAPLNTAIEALKVLHGFWDWLTSRGTQNHGGASSITAAVAAARANIPTIAHQAHRYTQAHGWETAQHGMWQYQQLVPGKGMQWMNDGRLPVPLSPVASAGFALEARARAMSDAMVGLVNASPALLRKNGGMAIVGQPLTAHATASGGGDTHYHITLAPGAAAIHLHALPHEGADQAVKRAVDQAGHEIATAIRRGIDGVGVGGPASGAFPTLRQTHR